MSKRLEHRPSDFRHQITLQSYVVSRDSEGLKTKTWSNVAGLENLPAKIHFLTGKELVLSSQVNSIHRAEVTIYMPDVMPDESMRLVFNGTNYDIKSIIPDDTNNVYLTFAIKNESK
jgi:SPP1 family predicted phage head-tail adaptor